MIDGTYTMQIDTPMGTKTGTAVVRTEGSKAYADIDAPIIGKQKAVGTVDGDSFSAEGSFKIMFVGKVDYRMRGEVVGDDLHMVIDSSKGTFEIRGVRA